MDENQMEKIVSLGKRRGFMFPGSDLYGGLANTYDYGPVGAELLRNIRNLWWETFVTKRDDIVGLDASVISHQEIWKASGHASGFSDAMIDCKNCKARFRADHILQDYFDKTDEKVVIEGKSLEEMNDLLKKHHDITCPNCGKYDWTEPRNFNLLFPVNIGIIEGDQSLAYLRGETAQGMFVNFENVINSTRVRLPFGIAQLGKSFRNEITPGNSVFRTLEFEQGEIEYFFDPKKQEWEKLFDEWKSMMWEFVTKTLSIKEENLRWRAHTDEERSFYSKRTEDLEYKFPFGFKELWGLAYRTDYDLAQHEKASKKELSILDPETNTKIKPHVIEPAVGINRLFLMALVDAYIEDGERTVLKLSPKLAPYKAAVFPLLRNKPELIEKARTVYSMLRNEITRPVIWDDRGNIGKRYLSQDEIGTPYCITVDFDTLEDESVTVRDRDTAKQERVRITELVSYLQQKLA